DFHLTIEIIMVGSFRSTIQKLTVYLIVSCHTAPLTLFTRQKPRQISTARAIQLDNLCNISTSRNLVFRWHKACQHNGRDEGGGDRRGGLYNAIAARLSS